jgi:hypothetical protein
MGWWRLRAGGGLGLEAALEYVTPDGPCGGDEGDEHQQNPEPAEIEGAGAFDAAAFDIFGEGFPGFWFGLGACAAGVGVMAGLEFLHPECLFQAQGCDVCADDAATEDAAGKITEGFCFQCFQLADGDLGLGGDGFQCESTPLAFCL